jgi:hypothetical protein
MLLTTKLVPCRSRHEGLVACLENREIRDDDLILVLAKRNDSSKMECARRAVERESTKRTRSGIT